MERMEKKAEEPGGSSHATIEVRDVHKRFGNTRALHGMSFVVRPGQITGFVGPNGAGKSTTMRVILGLDRPDRVGGRPYPTLRTPSSTSAPCSTPLPCSRVVPAVATPCGRWVLRRCGVPVFGSGVGDGWASVAVQQAGRLVSLRWVGVSHTVDR